MESDKKELINSIYQIYSKCRSDIYKLIEESKLKDSVDFEASVVIYLDDVVYVDWEDEYFKNGLCREYDDSDDDEYEEL